MSGPKIILASASPRRQHIMKECGVDFSVVVSNANEDFDSSKTPGEIVCEIASKKAKQVFLNNPDCIVIGCDTMVFVENTMLGKPVDETDARNMLKLLDDKWNHVYTGVAIYHPEGEIVFSEKSSVLFGKMDEDFINWYLKADEIYDAAGGYAIQGKAMAITREIRGSLSNIYGMPIDKILPILKKLTI